MSRVLDTVNSYLSLLLIAIGLYLANNFRRQLQMKMVERRFEAYARLWALLKDSGPWRKELGCDPITLEERKELYHKMTDWYFGQGNGMLLTPVTRQLYLNAKFNMICENEYLRLNFKKLIGFERPEKFNSDTGVRRKYLKDLKKELDDYIEGKLEREEKAEELADYRSQERKEKSRWRGQLSADQLSLLRAQMRNDLHIFGLTYKKPDPLDKAFLETADVQLWKKPWRRPLKTPWRSKNPHIEREVQKRSIDRITGPDTESTVELPRLIVTVRTSDGREEWAVKLSNPADLRPH